MRKELIVGVAKRLAFAGACTTLLFMFGGASSASADNGPHVAGAGVVADGCASCHRTHTAKAGNLLKQAQPALCYSCHGTSGTGAQTDVQAGTGYSAKDRVTPAGALRGGGFVTARINSLIPTGQSANYSSPSGNIPVLGAGVATTSAHSADGAVGMAWGNGPISATANAGASINLSCGSCHDPHGNGNFRVLKQLPDETGLVTAALAVPIVDEVTKTYTTANYWKVDDTTATTVTGVAASATNIAGKPFIANVSAWCTTCHTRYLANGQGSVNSGDAVYSFRHTSNVGLQGRANCIQCHVSHGSNASVTALAQAAGDPGGAASTSSRLLRIDNKGTCQMCHNR